ncbi:MAG: hypothetical protein JEZ11_24545 [Desulfobacterales bacterium]|nr:hypothetical protein [Desulfobacterales bacterium]
MIKPTEKQFTKTIDSIGTFIFKYPTLMDDLQADSHSARLLAGNENPSIMASNIATMTGTLATAIVESPDDFNLKEVYSYDELEAVYDIFIKQVMDFRSKSALTKPPGDKKEGAVGSEKS